MLMMKTKNRNFKEASWKEVWLLVYPMMFFVVVPRILSICLIIAYTKELTLIFLIVFVLLGMIINCDHIQRDPGHVMLGILTNIFAPCIVIQEGSSFFKRSGIASSLLHSVGLLGLFLLVILGGINLCPDIASSRHAPILHCFMGSTTNQTLQRCQLDEVILKRCPFTNFSSEEVGICKQDLFSFDLRMPWASDEVDSESE